MASTPRRKRRRFGKLTFESLEPRVVLDAQLGALFADGSIAPVITDGDQLSASEVARAESQFVRFTSADELKQFLAEDSDKRYADLFGREAWRWWYPTYVTNVDGDLMLVRTDAMVTANAASGSDYSTTNIQVAGVDEGDLIKTDGRYLYIGREQDVTIVDVQAADKMRVLSRLSGQGTTSALYLSEDRLTVISQDSAVFGDPMPMIASDAPLSRRSWGGEPKFLVTVYDVSAPETPELISRLEIEGSYVDSRMIGDTVFLVSSHQFQLPAPEVVPANPDPILPGSDEAWRLAAGSNEAAISILPWPGPDPGGSRWVYETREQYWQRIGDQVLDLVLPHYALTDAAGEAVGAGWLSAAEATYRPLGGQDGQLVSITALDVGADVPAVVASSSAPIGSASTVYVSPQSLYVVTADWSSATLTSQIYKFSLNAEDGRIPLVAAGRVPGQVLNSFSLDEQGSQLRIVTQSGWQADAKSALYVLDQVGETLALVGQLENLAPAEQLYSVRFLGERAFVVTFGPDGGWWVDPLLTIDLSNPAEPRLEGELEIPGFSNYLQVLDGPFVLGLGRDADETNGRQLEPQVSLFDVSDFADPQLADRVSFGNASSSSEAFFNHHAISYFPEQRVLAVPLDTWMQTPVIVDWAGNPVLSSAEDGWSLRLPSWQSQLWVFRIDTTEGEPARIHVLGTIEHDNSILRSLRIGTQLFSISADTIQVHDLFDPGVQLGELYFGARAMDDWFPVGRNSQDNFLDVLANDRIGSDAGGVWMVTAVTSPASGAVTISDDGRGLLYTPAPNFLGTDSLVYTITGRDGSTDQARVTVDVNAWEDQRRMTELALDDLAQRLSVPVEEISVQSAEAVAWPDSCLGVPAPDLACLMVITPGFRIALWHAATTYVYHTDTRDTVILAETVEDWRDPLTPLPSEPVVRVRLEVVDASGQAAAMVQAGETFTLNMYVDDLRPEGDGVFAVYADVLYPGRLVSISDEGITFSSPYANGRSGEVEATGLIDELGAFADIDQTGDVERLLSSISFVARRAGTASFVLTPADEVGHEVLIYGSNLVVPADLVQWQGVEVEVVGGWNNSELPTDVNDDGRTTPQDALQCINAINAHGRQFLDRAQLRAAVAATDHFFFDVDGDDYLTPSDVVAIVNCVNTGVEPAVELSRDDSLPARPLASWIDWQTLNDWLHEERWQEPLQTLQLTPERTLDLVHQLLVTVDADRLDDLLRNSTPVDATTGRAAITPVLDAIRDHVSVDQLLDLADQLQANFDDLDLETVMPGLAPQISLTSAGEVFRDQFFTKLSDPLFLLDLLDG